MRDTMAHIQSEQVIIYSNDEIVPLERKKKRALSFELKTQTAEERKKEKKKTHK